MNMVGDDKKFSFAERLRSFTFAFRGLYRVLKTEHNFRIHLLTAMIAIILGVVMRITRADWLIVILCIGFVLFAEIMNTAVEKLTDIAEPKKNESAGLVKDIAAGAVLVASITALAAGLMVFLPYIFRFLEQ
jgi:diacylglycerol kinase